MQPRTFGPYTLLSVLGGAGIGRVHLGRTDKGVRVAVRVIRPEFAADPWFRACLRDEVEIVTRVRGPRVAALLDADAEADVPWLATSTCRRRRSRRSSPAAARCRWTACGGWASSWPRRSR